MNFILGFILLVLLTGFSGDVIIKSNIIDEVPQNLVEHDWMSRFFLDADTIKDVQIFP